MIQSGTSSPGRGKDSLIPRLIIQCVYRLLKAIHAGVGWVWDRDYIRLASYIWVG